MSRLVGLGGRLLFLAVLVTCILVGIYAADLNAESALAGWCVGIGVVIILVSIVVFTGRAENKAAIGFGLLILGVAPMGWWIVRPLIVMGAYKDHVAEYMAIASANADPFGKTTEASIKGKIVPVNMSKKKIDSLLMALPEDLRPSSPGEVGTIAALWWEERRVGSYGAGGGGAYKWECTVVLWDKSAKTPLAEASFEGSEPPSTSRNGATQTGSKPYKEIAEYLKTLHR